MSTPPRIFISCVSKEFHNGHDKDHAWYQSYRSVLSRELADKGVGYVVQQELEQGFGTLLSTLEQQLAGSAFLVHIVGDLAGNRPEPAALNDLFQRVDRDRLMECLTMNATGVRLDPTELSYTQWEYYLAKYFGAHRLVYIKSEYTPCGPAYAPPDEEQKRSQQRHLEALRYGGEHRTNLGDQGHLVRSVLRSLIQEQVIGPLNGVLPVHLEPALENLPKIRRDLQQRRRKEAFTHLFGAGAHETKLWDECAKPFGITGIELHTVLAFDQHQREASKAELTKLEAALDEIALGNYVNALELAQRAVEDALVGMRECAAPDRREELREELIAAYSLLSDVDDQLGRADRALESQKLAGAYMDVEREPLRWVRHHRDLAIRPGTHVSDAERLIREVSDVARRLKGDARTEYCLAEQTLARILMMQGKYSNAEFVLRSAIASINPQLPLEVDLAATCMADLGVVLMLMGKHSEAEPLLRLEFAHVVRNLGTIDPWSRIPQVNYVALLTAMGKSQAEIFEEMRKVLEEAGIPQQDQPS